MTRKYYSFTDLLAMEACTGCRLCADICPAVSVSGDGRLSGLYRLDRLKTLNRSRWNLFKRILPGKNKLSPDAMSGFGKTIFNCTLCGHCQSVCPMNIPLKDIWVSLREDMADSGASPEQTGMILENLMASHNVFNEDNEERAEWVEDLDDPPDDGFIRDSAEVVYFTGCVASYFPMAQKIPIEIVGIFEKLGVDFTLLGEEEWCCGFPLIGAGLGESAKKIIEHNMEAIRSKDASAVVFSCPSCRQMWEEYYPKEFELYHVTEYLDRLFREKTPSFRQKEITVTYHDPCDLGRAGGIYHAPRDLIQSIPGVRLVEMEHNRENCLCCGGGGNLEMIDARLSAEIAKRKMNDVMQTGADAVVTACQQCVRTMTGHVRKKKLDVKVMDISELIGMVL